MHRPGGGGRALAEQLADPAELGLIDLARIVGPLQVAQDVLVGDRFVVLVRFLPESVRPHQARRQRHDEQYER